MRITFEGPDDIMRAYVVLSEQLGAPRRAALTENLGELCKTCNGGPATWVGPKHAQVLVCTQCDREWEGEPLLALRQFSAGGSAQGELPPSVANMLEQWRMVRALVEDRPRHYTKSRWEYVTVCLCAYLDPRVGTYENVATYGARRFPRRAWEWSPARVRTAVAQARADLGKRGSRAGILQGWAAPKNT